jgi:uncharacterized protein (DUF885 family)
MRRFPLAARPLWLIAALALAAAEPATSAVAQLTAQTPARNNDETAFARRYADVVESRGRESDSTRLSRLFATDWDWTNTEFPEAATYVGYPGQNARWTDNSLGAIERRNRHLQQPLAAIRSIDRARLSAAAQLDYDLFRKNVEDAIEGTRFKTEYMPVTQLGGPQYLADIIAIMPASRPKDYEDILARLNGIPAVVDQAIVLMDRGLAAGITPPRITLRDVPGQIDNLLAADPTAGPLYRPFAELPPAVPAAERERLRAEAKRAIAERVMPAYRRLRAYLAERYIPRTRESIGMSALPDGAAWYAYNVRQQTTTRLTPQQIHATGLAEVKRIRGQMDSVIAAVGFKGSFAEFTRFLRTDPQFFFTDSASLVRAYRDIAKRTDPGLVRLFGRLPRLPYGVIAVPSYAAKSQTTAYYQGGSLDAGRPAYYFVNTYALDTRPKWEMEALTLHEAVPGHHLQIALAQELESVPEFRRFGGYTAYVEGWALYAESLGPELGMYRDPYSKFGQLTYEMWRAVRLVLDTGIHSMGWTRQQAIDFFKANSAKTEHDIVVEVDRYIVNPAQALAYKTGELKIKELRAAAAAARGPRFDVRAFHDEVLGSGALPLDVLETRVRAWIARQRTKA